MPVKIITITVIMFLLINVISVNSVLAVSPQGNSGIIDVPDGEIDEDIDDPFVPEIKPDIDKEIVDKVIPAVPIDVLKVASDIIKSMSKGDSAEIDLGNVSRVSVSNLKKLANMSISRGVTVKLVVNHIVDGKVMLSMKIDPLKARNLNGDINLECAIDNKPTRTVFEKYFDNEIDIVSFGHKGDFGMDIEIITNSNFNEKNQKSLKFYSYDSKTNKYDYIKNPDYSIDENGKLNFKTSIGGDIIITDKNLTLKK